MNTATATATEYEFTYRGYTIKQKGSTYTIAGKDAPWETTELIDIIKAVDGQWARMGR